MRINYDRNTFTKLIPALATKLLWLCLIRSCGWITGLTSWTHRTVSHDCVPKHQALSSERRITWQCSLLCFICALFSSSAHGMKMVLFSQLYHRDVECLILIGWQRSKVCSYFPVNAKLWSSSRSVDRMTVPYRHFIWLIAKVLTA